MAHDVLAVDQNQRQNTRHQTKRRVENVESFFLENKNGSSCGKKATDAQKSKNRSEEQK